MTIMISRTDLARNTRKAIEQARKGQPVVVESYGEEQVAIVDAVDYRLMQAVMRYQARDHSVEPADITVGLTEEMLQQVVEAAEGDVQARWNRVVAAHQDHEISFGRAAELLHMNRYELTDRYNRLGIPLHLGPATVEEAQREFGVLLANRNTSPLSD